MVPDASLPPAFKCRYPILLLHGFLGFVERRIGPFRIVYFRGVVPYLEAAGNRVFAIEVHPTRSIEHRAGQIKEFIEAHSEIRESPLNLVAHSMGGLDARFLISRMEGGNQVKSLTTLSTPHRGSFLADIGQRIPGAKALFPAIADLTEKHMAVFNQEIADRDGILYSCVPSGTHFRKCRLFMWPSLALLRFLGGPNDGQVTVQSATWGKVLVESDMDHLRMVGMSQGRGRERWKHLELFRLITQTLSEQGL